MTWAMPRGISWIDYTEATPNKDDEIDDEICLIAYAGCGRISSLKFTQRCLLSEQEVTPLEKKKAISKVKPKEYKKPSVKKHENLKNITLLSFNPPEN